LTAEIIYDYPPPVSELLTLGDPRQRLRRIDYHKIGLTEEHIPDLIRMLQDNDLHWADSEGTEVWAPLHAWRALGALRSDLAVAPLEAFLTGPQEGLWARVTAASSLGKIGQTHPSAPIRLAAGCRGKKAGSD